MSEKMLFILREDRVFPPLSTKLYPKVKEALTKLVNNSNNTYCIVSNHDYIIYPPVDPIEDHKLRDYQIFFEIFHYREELPFRDHEDISSFTGTYYYSVPSAPPDFTPNLHAILPSSGSRKIGLNVWGDLQSKFKEMFNIDVPEFILQTRNTVVSNYHGSGQLQMAICASGVIDSSSVVYVTSDDPELKLVDEDTAKHVSLISPISTMGIEAFCQFNT
jgi:hypothetical protein